MVRAITFPDHVGFRATDLPGAVHFDLVSEHLAMWFRCPCGCGALARIRVGHGVKPEGSPSWNWNGSITDPSLTPSVNQLGCGWHGWLRDGYWEAC